MQRIAFRRNLDGGTAKGRALRELEPEAIARVSALDSARWGRQRYQSEGVEYSALPSGCSSRRILPYLEGLYHSGPGGAELAPILLYGLGAAYGTADLNNKETRLTVHHLPLIARRYLAARAEALAIIGVSESGDVSSEGEGRAPPPWARGTEAKAPPFSASSPSPRADSAQLLAHCWAIYHTYLELRQQGEALTGAPEDESFQGIRREDATEREAFKAFLWYELADLVFLGVQHQLMRLTLSQIGEALSGGKVGWLLQVFGLGLVFGEGRSHQRLRMLAAHLLEPALVERFEAAGVLLADAMEERFRHARRLEQIDTLALSEAVAELHQSWPELAPRSLRELETVATRQRETALFEVEEYLEQRAQEQLAQGAPRQSGDAWTQLSDRMRSLLEDFEAGKLDWGALEASQRALRSALDRAAHRARQMPEFLHWPGDGENYRARRQRNAAPADRLYHLIGLGERLHFALGLFRNSAAAQGESRPDFGTFHDLMEHDEASIFLEEWVARLGPRAEPIFGGTNPEVRLPGNRTIRATDRCVRELVALARQAGADPRDWGWYHCGVTDRLREVIRRVGPGHAFVGELRSLLERGRIGEAVARVHAFVPPGGEPEDRDAYVTVGVHVFNADIEVVRQNLLHNKHLYWNADKRWLLLGSSSADRAIAEQERQICLESGVTHYFIAARRHQKAGNQNRVIPNVPAHPEGRSFYLTLDDDYISGSQTLPRLVHLAERHPDAAFVQLPLYLYGNSLPGISRARHADAAAMVVWGSITSLGIRDLRLFPDRFANRRTLALPFGTCTLFRLAPGRNSLEDTSGFHTDTVCEDFAQGLLAFSMKHMHHPRRPKASWDDGILLDEIWIEGDGVELNGRLHQQTRWCEGSTRNAWTIWLPAIKHHVQQRLGLVPLTEDRPPSLPQITGGSAMVLGYTLEFISMLLFMIGFPLTSLMAEPAKTLGHSISFWAALWTIHMGYSYYLAFHCGMSLRTFLDQQFIRFTAITGLARGIYQSFRSPAGKWSACKDTKARVPWKTDALYLSIAALNLMAAILGTLNGMKIYLLCLVTVVTALWSFQLKQAVPVNARARIRNLPRSLHRPLFAWLAFKWEGRSDKPAREEVRPIPHALMATALLLILTSLAMTARYIELAQFLPSLLHQHPLFLTWLLASDLVQLMSLSWIWLFTACGIRNQALFSYSNLVEAGRLDEGPDFDPARAENRARRLRPLGRFLSYAVGGRAEAARVGFLSSSGAWMAIALIALLLRVIHLSTNGAFMDESYYIIAGRRYFSEGGALPMAWVMFGSYLYPILTAAASYVGGLEGSRLLSVFFGIVAVVSTGQVGERIGGHITGILAALCAAVAFPAIYISTLATYDGPSVAGVALSAAFLATALWGRGAAEMGEGKRCVFLAASSLALVFGTLAKYVAVIFAPGMVLIIGLETLVKKPYGDILFARLASWAFPFAAGLGLYAYINFDILKEWWDFSLSYKSLISSDLSEVIYIYLIQGWDVLLALAIALGGMILLLRWWRREGSASSQRGTDGSRRRAWLEALVGLPESHRTSGREVRTPSHESAAPSSARGPLAPSSNRGPLAPSSAPGPLAPSSNRGPLAPSSNRGPRFSSSTPMGQTSSIGGGQQASQKTPSRERFRAVYVRSQESFGARIELLGAFLLLLQVVVFFTFHFATRADINYLKHINYAFPFLLPLTGLGLIFASEWLRSFFQGHGLTKESGRRVGQVFVALLIVMLGLYQVDVMSGALRWWPDLRPFDKALEVGLQKGDQVLTDDTGAEWYAYSKGAQVDTPFYLSFEGKIGPAAATAKLRRRLYDVVVFSGGVTGEGKELHEAVIGEVYASGYKRVYALPGDAPHAGLYVAPRALPRFARAEAAAEAEYARIQRQLIGEPPVSFFEMVEKVVE